MANEVVTHGAWGSVVAALVAALGGVMKSLRARSRDMAVIRTELESIRACVARGTDAIEQSRVDIADVRERVAHIEGRLGAADQPAPPHGRRGWRG